MELTINNKRITDFIKKYDIDIELFLLKNIDFYEYVISSINDNNTSQILPYILNQNNLINNLIEKSNKLDYNIELIKTDKAILMTEVEKLRNENTNNIKDIQNIILKNNVEYINTTSNIINDLEKTINSSNSKDINNIMNNFEKRLIENNNFLLTNTKEIILNVNTNNDKDILSLSKDIELITNKSFQDIKEYIDKLKNTSPKEFEIYFDKFNDKNNNYVQHIREFLTNEFCNIKSCIDDTKSSVNNISNIFLHKNSSIKGKTSENILEILLSKKFPTYIIDRTSSESHSGDFILKDNNKPDVLIENKDYEKNVNTDEIIKFHRDIKENNICGILVSQNSGISCKHNFEIEIVNNNILMYIHNCNYDMDKINFALDIIYSLYDYVNKNKNNNKNYINDETFQNIQKEYLEFIKNRNDIINSLNLSIKNLKKMDLISIRDIIEKYSNNLPNITNDSFTCPECNKIFTSVSSLAAHKKKHFNELKKKVDT
jgi:hypothetical protein